MTIPTPDYATPVQTLTSADEVRVLGMLRDLCRHGYGELTIRIMQGKIYMVYVRQDVKLSE